MSRSPKVREVLPGIFVVHLPLPMKPSIVNVTLVRAGGEWVLIDTGMRTADSLAEIEAALREVGCEPRQLRTILATHHHPDHFGASQAIQERTGAQVWMHPREYESALHYAPRTHSEEILAFFRQHGIPLQRFPRVPSAGEFWAQLYGPAKPDRLLADGDRLIFGEREIQVVATPGHTSGHCVFFLVRERVLVAGDHLLPKITPHVGFFPGGPPNPLGDFLASQRKVQDLDVGLVLPAHGGVFSDHRHRAQQIIQHHHYRLREMLDLVRHRPRTAYEVASQAWGFDVDGPLQVQFPATFEALAHLEYLRDTGEVRREERDGTTYYQAC
jgi:glyoxylase-like metal-dependent hydrolase (beta-lactamase superfamily II)